MANRDLSSGRLSPDAPDDNLRKRITDQVRRTRGLLTALALGSAIGTGSDYHPVDAPTRNSFTVSRSDHHVDSHNDRQLGETTNRLSGKDDREFADLSNEDLQLYVQHHFGEVDTDISGFKTSLTEYSRSQLSSINAELPREDQSQDGNKIGSPVEFLTLQVKEALDAGDRTSLALELAHSSALRRHGNSEEADEVMSYEDQVTRQNDMKNSLQGDIYYALTELEYAENAIKELIRRGVDKNHMTSMLKIVQQRIHALEVLEADMSRRWGSYEVEGER